MIVFLREDETELLINYNESGSDLTSENECKFGDNKLQNSTGNGYNLSTCEPLTHSTENIE